MTLKLMYITNKANIANIAENSGVDWIFIDLEINGKYERQGHLDTVISHHSMDDIKKIKQNLTRSELLVRVNSLYEFSKEEIDTVINEGADIVMLPFFKTKEEVETFISFVNGRAQTCLLLETPDAVDNIDSILEVEGIDYIHIGLNDLHIGYNMRFMFELLVDGTVEKLCNTIREKGIPYGFGGIGRIGHGMLPAEYIIAEHHRLGSSMAILSRSFCNANTMNDLAQIAEVFEKGIDRIKDYEYSLLKKNQGFFAKNKGIIYNKVLEIVGSIAK